MCYPGDWSNVPGASNGQVAMSSYDGTTNGGTFGVVLIASYYDDASASSDAPVYGYIAASLRADFPGQVQALVSLKGASSCAALGQRALLRGRRHGGNGP